MDFLEIFKKIILIREFEKKLDFLFKQGLVKGTAHFCIGQEFIPIIISQYITTQDSVTSTHRGHGHALAKNLEVKKLFAEILGKKDGYNSGKGGSQHISSDEHNFIANGVSGGMLPVATGIAFANKYKRTKNVTVAYLGDGAVNEGHVQEALNLAKVLKLPILFVCENNQYAMSTPMKKSHAAEICSRIRGLEIKCQSVPDNDFMMLDSVAKEFIQAIRQESEPYFIEVKTYRHLGHSKNDKNLYRDKEEEKYWFERDVYITLKKKILDSKLATEKELEAVEKDSVDWINSIAAEVVTMPGNNPADIAKWVYAA